MNVLILSCGTRNKLVQFFKKCNRFDKVVVTDCSNQAPALYEADNYYIVPRMDTEGYLDCLLDICQKEQIALVIPLQEEELLLIAKNKKLFENKGVCVAVSDYEKVLLCKNKYELNTALNGKGVPAVETIPVSEYLEQMQSGEEVYVKPVCGAGSINTFPVRSKRLLKELMRASEEKLVIQPRMKGKEYGVDVYADLVSGEIITCFCKEKLRMRAGETEKSISVILPEVEKLAADAVTLLGLRGPLDVDIMEHDGQYYILEINPRFGGGYPHAYACGVSFPEYLAVNADGRVNAVCRNQYPENILAMKYSELIVKEP